MDLNNQNKTSAQEGLQPQADYIKNLFGSISKTYDTANDLMTFGMARKWRKKLVEWSEAQEGQRILDCATGTGDLAIDFKKVVGPIGEVIGSDFCAEMIELAPPKARKQDLDINFELGDVTQLKYDDHSFDVCSIAYGIRNVNDTVKALTEMARVTKKDGYVMILETGDNYSPVLNTFINFYFRNVVPKVGGLVSGKQEAYEYLQNSSQSFPSKENFLKLMEKTNRFKKLEYKSILGGASYLYKGTVS